MEQLSFYFEDEEVNSLKHVVKRSIVTVRKKFPRPVSEETIDEYKQFLKEEILLEIADRLQELAMRRFRKAIK